MCILCLALISGIDLSLHRFPGDKTTLKTLREYHLPHMTMMMKTITPTLEKRAMARMRAITPPPPMSTQVIMTTTKSLPTKITKQFPTNCHSLIHERSPNNWHEFGVAWQVIWAWNRLVLPSPWCRWWWASACRQKVALTKMVEMWCKKSSQIKRLPVGVS